MRRILIWGIMLALTLGILTDAHAQSDYRIRDGLVVRSFEGRGGVPLWWDGFFYGQYAGTTRDCIYYNYTGSGNNILDLNGDGVEVLTLTKAGLLTLAGSPAVDSVILREITTPTAVASSGQVYTKTDNSIYFQDGAGTEHPIVVSDYAGIYVDNNTDPTTINVVDTFEHVTGFDSDMPEHESDGDNSTDSITIGATGDYSISFHTSASSAGNNKTYQYFAFEIASSGDTISGATEATPCVITATGHSFSNGDRVKITGVVGMTELNDRVFTVASAAADTFALNDDEGVAINSTGFTTYVSDGTAVLATQLPQVHSHRKYAIQNDVGSASGCGYAALTLGNAIELYIKGETDATNITIEACVLMIQRLR